VAISETFLWGGGCIKVALRNPWVIKEGTFF
jgi:hypothetical protein